MGGAFGFIGFLASLFAVGTWLSSRDVHWIAVGVALACFALALAFGLPATKYSDRDCFIDWDGRSNSTVCD